MTTAEAQELAERFWNLSAGRESFPRSLERTILWVVPLLIIKLPRLDVGGLRRWLAERGVAMDLPPLQRRLRGCLVANRGAGVVFLDGADPAEEQRLSLAHELAHFLLEHYWPRQRILAAFGAGIREVLDGLRPPTEQERLNALLRDVRLRTLTHLMDRGASGRIARAEVLEAEDRADRLALELLAPWADALRAIRSRGISWAQAGAAATAASVLADVFGLPHSAAESYAEYMAGSYRGRQSFRQWLGL